MANFTRQAIKASFMQLLNERPYNKITVKDIVDGCGVNRNSFYYHFQDVPSLMVEIIQDETSRIISGYPAIESLEECIEVAIQFALENRRAVMHIYNSVNRDLYEHYLWQVCDYTVRHYVNNAFGARKLREDDKELLIRHFKCECFGVVCDWMENGMKTDILTQFHRLYGLKRGQVEELVARCEIKE